MLVLGNLTFTVQSNMFFFVSVTKNKPDVHCNNNYDFMKSRLVRVKCL